MKHPTFQSQEEKDIIPVHSITDMYSEKVFETKKLKEIFSIREQTLSDNKIIVTFPSRVCPPYTEEDDF